MRLRSRPIFLLILALAAPSWPAGARAADSPVKGAAAGGSSARAAADFTLPTTTGKVALHELSGKVVLVDFWASWCTPCRQSFPWLSAVSTRYAANNFVVVAINLDKSREAAQAFLREFAPGFLVAFDPAGKSAEAYDVQAMPSSYLVGRDGRLLFSHAGFVPRDEGELEARIQEAIAK